MFKGVLFMSEFKRISPEEINDNPFKLIGKDWGLVTGGTKDGFNTMTISWGGIGVMWNKPVAFTFIRPQRYTYEFLEKDDIFTISFYDESYRKALSLCGSKSGRDINKPAETLPTTACLISPRRGWCLCAKSFTLRIWAMNLSLSAAR